MIAAAGLLLTVKVDAIWQGRGHIAEIASAQTPPAPQGGALNPAQFGRTPGGTEEVPQRVANPAPVTPAALSTQSPPPLPSIAMPSTAMPAGTPVTTDMSDANCSAQTQVLSDLAKRRTQLDQRSDELDRRGLLLKAVEQRLDGKIQKLQQLQTSINGLLGQVDQQQQDRLNSLVHIYENMKPNYAAGILQQMEMPILLQIMSRMRDLKAGPILAAMDPDKARAVTLALAEKQQLPDDAKNLSQSN
jgi:flagellar motility protein MotE (MotC chaperone)